jgi:catechol 2,3-dioxygenase-like lactoylglutathione lyase family enzyme
MSRQHGIEEPIMHDSNHYGAPGWSVSRRFVLTSLAALATAPRAFAQTAGIKLLKLHNFEIGVADVDASVAFYQALFGMPVQARSAQRICLRIGDGPQYMAIRAVREDETAGITHLGYSVDGYDAETVSAALQRHGFGRIDPPPLAAAGFDHPMKTWIRLRGAMPEVYFSDARGLIVQLSDPRACGGTASDGAACDVEEPAPQGPMRLRDINHFTVFVDDGAAANEFYQQMFDLQVQAYQGPQAPVTGIGDGRQFVMYAGSPRGEPAPANIHHGCFSMEDFDVERVLSMLTEQGLTARGDGPVGPLMHYVSLRMPERGGAPGGTPELYFTDLDGILLQLQDIRYCGGGGYLGEECLSV